MVTRQSLLPGPQWHNKSHVGAVANITFSYRVRCQQNYYGDSCRKFCVPRNDHLGHYSCDSSGTKVCSPGWSGVYCDTGKPRCFALHSSVMFDTSLFFVSTFCFYLKGATSRFVHLKNFSLNVSRLSFAIRVNLLHP